MIKHQSKRGIVCDQCSSTVQPGKYCISTYNHKRQQIKICQKCLKDLTSQIGKLNSKKEVNR